MTTVCENPNFEGEEEEEEEDDSVGMAFFYTQGRSYEVFRCINVPLFNRLLCCC